MSERIDDLIVRYVDGDGDDAALDGLLAAGAVSLRRLLAVRAGRVDPGWHRGRADRGDRDVHRRPGSLLTLLARAFPDALFEALADDPALEPVVLETLCHLQDHRAAPVLERALHSERAGDRSKAVRGLEVNGTAAHTPALLACLTDREVRSEAVAALGRLGDARAAGPLLREYLADDSVFAWRAGLALEQVEQRIGGPLAPPRWQDLGPVEFEVEPVLGPWCVTQVLVRVGQVVRAGELLAVVENEAFGDELVAGHPGTVTEVRIAVGDELRHRCVALVVHSRRRVG